MILLPHFNHEMCTVCVKNAKLSQPFEFDMWYNELIYDIYIYDIWCVVMFCSLCTLRAIASRFALLAVWLAIVRPIAACQLPKAWRHYPQVIGQHQGGTRQSAASFAEPLARQALRCRLDCRQRGTLWSHGQQGSGTSQKAWFVGYALQSGTENLLHSDSDKTFSDQAWTDDMTNPTLTNCEVIIEHLQLQGLHNSGMDVWVHPSWPCGSGEAFAIWSNSPSSISCILVHLREVDEFHLQYELGVIWICVHLPL